MSESFLFVVSFFSADGMTLPINKSNSYYCIVCVVTCVVTLSVTGRKGQWQTLLQRDAFPSVPQHDGEKVFFFSSFFSPPLLPPSLFFFFSSNAEDWLNLGPCVCQVLTLPLSHTPSQHVLSLQRTFSSLIGKAQTPELQTLELVSHFRE